MNKNIISITLMLITASCSNNIEKNNEHIYCYMQSYATGKEIKLTMYLKQDEYKYFIKNYMMYIENSEKNKNNFQKKIKNSGDFTRISFSPKKENKKDINKYEPYSFVCIINGKKIPDTDTHNSIYDRTKLTSIFSKEKFNLKPYFTQKSWNNLFSNFPEK